MDFQKSSGYLKVKTEEDTEKNEDEIIQNETMEY